MKKLLLLPAFLLLSLMTGCKDKIPSPVPDPGTIVKPGEEVFSAGGLVLTFIDKSAGIDSSWKRKIIGVFFTNYPRLLNDFNPDAPKRVTFIVDPAFSGVAATYPSGTVYFSYDYYKDHLNDIDVATHEIMHIVQAYRGAGPWWITEGIADYVRYVYGIDNAAAGWSLPSFALSQHYTQGYSVTARFLVWLEVRVKPGIVKELDQTMRDDFYSDDFWMAETGKPIDSLWADYARDPSF